MNRGLDVKRGYVHPPRLAVDRWATTAFAVLLAAYVATPFVLSEFWLTLLVYAGTASLGALGLNLLTGSTGQVSAGHAAFAGLGAYVAAFVGDDLGLPLPIWLLAAATAGAAVGAALGPLALRLSQGYLVLVTLGFAFLAEHLFRNWEGLTGGPIGRGVVAPASLGVDVDHVSVADHAVSRAGGWFWMVWAMVALCALSVANILRSRTGRALQAVRDGELPARVMGVDTTRFKVQAFVAACALAAVSGALLAVFQSYIAPGDWDIGPSIAFMSMIIVGGLGKPSGAIVGALFITILPRVIERYSNAIPGLMTGAGDEGIITVFALNKMIYGLAIVGFLLFEPGGLVRIWHSLTRRMRHRTARLGADTAGKGQP